MVKKIAFQKDVKIKLREGITLLANAVKVTLGPKGRNVIINDGVKKPYVTKEGEIVARAVILEDPFQNMGATIIKESGEKTKKEVGDGTTTAILLAATLFEEGLKYVLTGHDPMQIKKGLDEGLKAILKALDRAALPSPTLEKIGSIAAKDAVMGKIVAEVLEKVGSDGIVSVETSSEKEITLKYVKGLKSPSGYASPYFVNVPAKMECVFDNPYIFVTDKKLTSVKDVVPILELAVKKEKKPLLIIAESIEGEALQTIVINKLKGGAEVACMKAPYFGEDRFRFLQDVALLTGGELVSDLLGTESFDETVLGRAESVRLDKESTLFLGGFFDPKKLEERILNLRKEIERAKSAFAKKVLQERLSSLTGGSAVIQVGAFTEIAREEKREQIEDAIHAARAAMKEGVIIGGGVAYLRALPALEKIELEGDSQIGIALLKKALKEPLKAIVSNGGFSGEEILEKMAEQGDSTGFNAESGIFENFIEKGIVDPILVVKRALSYAVSTAGMLLTVEVMVSEKEVKQ